MLCQRARAVTFHPCEYDSYWITSKTYMKSQSIIPNVLILKKPLAKFKSAKIGLLLVWVFVLKEFNVLSSCSLFLFSLLLLSHLNCRISLPNSRLSYIQSMWCVCVRSANAFHTDNKILYANNGRRFRLLGEILTRHFTLKLMLNRPKKVIFFIFLNMSSI